MSRIPISIRLAAAHERRLLEALQLRASLANPGDRDAIAAHPDAIELPLEQIMAGQVFIAQSAGIIAGFSSVQFRRDGDMELDGLFVEPGMWRRGIGRQLVERCCEVARQNNARALHVVGNPHAEGFYLSCGFEGIGRQDTRFGVGFSMTKNLT